MESTILNRFARSAWLAELLVTHFSEQEQILSRFGVREYAFRYISRYLGLDPESALCKTNRRFRRRCEWMEEHLREQGTALESALTDELESLWQQTKQQEKQP
jgi:uncharacterized protein YabN with tetrapyrrole methylase and pyrophosphatase domain